MTASDTRHGWDTLATACREAEDTIAALRAALDAALARATRAELALSDVNRAVEIIAAEVCDDCADGRPVIDPDRGIGHVVERGRAGPGDPDTIDSWRDCEAEWMWQALRRARAVELRVLAEPNS